MKFTLLPPRPNVCQVCAENHAPTDPHNKESLFYNYSFHAEYGRWPSWLDAMSHCGEETKKAWSAELIKRGKKIDQGAIAVTTTIKPGSVTIALLQGPKAAKDKSI